MRGQTGAFEGVREELGELFRFSFSVDDVGHDHRQVGAEFGQKLAAGAAGSDASDTCDRDGTPVAITLVHSGGRCDSFSTERQRVTGVFNIAPRHDFSVIEQDGGTDVKMTVRRVRVIASL